jgi:hypothetical protein
MEMISRDSSVGIATRLGMKGRGVRVRFSAGARDFSLLHAVQTGSGAHTASRLKRPGREADYLPPSTAKVKNGGDILLLRHTSSWYGA